MRFGLRTAGAAALALMIARPATIETVGPTRLIAHAAIVTAAVGFALAIDGGPAPLPIALATLRTIVAAAIRRALTFTSFGA